MVGQLYWRATCCHLVRRNVLGGNLLGARLRDVPVLAELAVHVAAGGGDGEGRGAGQVVEERLLLNGIDVRGADARVDQRVVDAAAILAHAAVAALLVAHDALARAELAAGSCGWPASRRTCLEGELRVVLRFRAGWQRDGSGGRGQFAGAESRSRGQRAPEKRAAIDGRTRRAFCGRRIRSSSCTSRRASHTSTTVMRLGSQWPSRCSLSAAVAM